MRDDPTCKSPVCSALPHISSSSSTAKLGSVKQSSSLPKAHTMLTYSLFVPIMSKTSLPNASGWTRGSPRSDTHNAEANLVHLTAHW